MTALIVAAFRARRDRRQFARLVAEHHARGADRFR